MFIKDFQQTNVEKIASLQKTLKEEFGIAIVNKFPTEDKLKLLKDSADRKIVSIKGSTQKFQLEPEYIKYLGIRDLSASMLAEGMYAESPAYEEMKNNLAASVQEMMDSGYTMDEASSECMNRYRMDPRYAFDDEHVKTIILKAAKDHMESSCGSKYEAIEEEGQEANTELNEYLLRELAKECGVELEDIASYEAIEEKINQFAEVSGKSRDAVVGFLNGLEEDAVVGGIQMFGKKIAQENFALAAADAGARGDKEFEYPKGSGKMHKVTMNKKTADKISDEDDKKNESMFDDIIDQLLAEEVESVDEAEVVMAVRALADDIQDHVERLGRMVNEDLPAIADQMVSEFGLEKAQGFKENAEGVLSGALESAKGAKEGMDGLIGNITGVGSLATSDLEADDDAMMPVEEPIDPEPMDMDVNEPAAAGPEDEPLGRAPVEV